MHPALGDVTLGLSQLLLYGLLGVLLLAAACLTGGDRPGDKSRDGDGDTE